MALRFDMVPLFLQKFSKIRSGISSNIRYINNFRIIIDPGNNAINYVLLGIGVIIMGMIIIQSTGAVGWQSGQWWGDNWQMIVGIIILFILIAVVIGSGSSKKNNAPPTTYVPVYAKR